MNRKVHVACNFNFFSKTEDFSMTLQPVTYTVNVVISRKRCQMESLLLQTTNRKWYVGLSNRGNSDDVESQSRSFLLKAFQMWFFVQLGSNWQGFNWHSASRVPSAVAELLVLLCLHSFVHMRHCKKLNYHTASMPYHAYHQHTSIQLALLMSIVP